MQIASVVDFEFEVFKIEGGLVVHRYFDGRWSVRHRPNDCKHCNAHGWAWATRQERQELEGAYQRWARQLQVAQAPRKTGKQKDDSGWTNVLEQAMSSVKTN